MSNRSELVPKKRNVKHDPDFKKKVALEYLTSGKTTRFIADQYPPIHYTQVALWAKQLKKKLKVNPSVTLPISMEKVIKRAEKSESQSLKERLDMANLRIAGLETMIDIAEDLLGVDIRKKYGTKQFQ